MTLALRHRRPHQPHFREWAPAAPLETREHAATALGAFYEHLTAALVGGHRVRVDRGHGDNPDVVTDDGRLFESKATSSARWVLNREQHDRFAVRPDAYYVLWWYSPPDHPIKDFGTVHALHEWCGAHVRQVYVIAADLVGKILAHSKFAAPRYSNRRWGWNYFLHEKRVRQVLERRVHRNPITPWVHVVRDDLAIAPDAECFPLRVCDVDVAPLPVTYIVPTRYFVSSRDQALAAAALGELARDRLQVVLIPSTDPRATRGSKVRAVVSTNPPWYQDFVARRMYRTGRQRRARPAGDRRRRVRDALELLAAGRAHPRETWIGWELLDLLREAEEREVRRG